LPEFLVLAGIFESRGVVIHGREENKEEITETMALSAEGEPLRLRQRCPLQYP